MKHYRKWIAARQHERTRFGIGTGIRARVRAEVYNVLVGVSTTTVHLLTYGLVKRIHSP